MIIAAVVCMNAVAVSHDIAADAEVAAAADAADHAMSRASTPPLALIPAPAGKVWLQQCGVQGGGTGQMLPL